MWRDTILANFHQLSILTAYRNSSSITTFYIAKENEMDWFVYSENVTERHTP
jgi:hypothetical protein